MYCLINNMTHSNVIIDVKLRNNEKHDKQYFINLNIKRDKTCDDIMMTIGRISRKQMLRSFECFSVFCFYAIRCSETSLYNIILVDYFIYYYTYALMYLRANKRFSNTIGRSPLYRAIRLCFLYDILCTYRSNKKKNRNTRLKCSNTRMHPN